MLDKSQLKRYFLIVMVASLAVSALMGILAILVGNFGETEFKILLTTLVFGLFSIAGLANLRNLESTRAGYRSFAWLGIAFSVAALALSVFVIWGSQTELVVKWMLTFGVLSLASAHASLLLPSINDVAAIVSGVALATLISITFVVILVLYFIFAADKMLETELYFRLLGVVAILDVFGTITVPILSKVMAKKS